MLDFLLMVYLKKSVFLWSLCLFILLAILVIVVYVFFGRSKMSTKELLPGITSLSPVLLKEFKTIRGKKGSSYRPRTRHLDSQGKALFTNRLFLEKSPYLLQHAHNPVNWYPWAEQAFEEAKEKNRPILLSIGYSTCHWCHVMEEESFEDLEIARYINENYIAIKVDREERPDIDSVYMSAVQMITGRGGWPMTIWLTPQKQIFYGGTYFPPRTGVRGASMGFLSLLEGLKKAYGEKQEDISKTGENISRALQEALSSVEGSDSIPDTKIFQDFISQLRQRWDPVYGGIQGAPKFPSSFPSRFLLRTYLKAQDKNILNAIQSYLNGMMKGGLHDHVGGGFHRYSTDEKWLVPHFEKMLYDQALLSLTYLEAYQHFKTESYKETAVGILDYVARDMQSKKGGFYSATDADSLVFESNKIKNTISYTGTGKREEGFYFTWTPEEIDQVLDKQQAELIKNYYGVTSAGNFEGRNIFYISKELSETAKELKLDFLSAQKLLNSSLKILYQTRQLRPLPLRDEKILSSWNALMISAFVYGYFILNEKKYLLQAEKSARFVLNNMRKKGRLYRSWKEGTAYIPAYLDDYVFFISALLDLFEWTGNREWLNNAIELDQVLEKNFEDKKRGGFFMTGQDYETLMVREKPFYDGAEPSGNSIAIMNLLRLSELTGNDAYRARAKKTLKAFAVLLEKNPFAFSEALLALDYYHSRVNEIVLVLPDNAKLETDPLFNELKNWYLPNKVLTLIHHSQVEKQQNLLKPITRKTAIEGKTTIYICEKGACQLPTSDLKELKRQLKEVQGFGYN